jgi:hypothetical protein
VRGLEIRLNSYLINSAEINLIIERRTCVALNTAIGSAHAILERRLIQALTLGEFVRGKRETNLENVIVFSSQNG